MVKPVKTAPSGHYRLGVFSRLLAVLVGGYTLVTLCVACLAQGLSMVRSEAVLTATLPAFLILCCAAIWVFAARSAWHAWCGLLIPCLALGASYLWLAGAVS